MDIYARLVKPFRFSFSTSILQTDDYETLLTGTSFHWFTRSSNRFKVENSDGVFEFRMKPVKTPRRGLLARMRPRDKQAVAVAAPPGRRIRVTKHGGELLVEDLDTGIVVAGRDDTPRRLFAEERHFVCSSLGNFVMMEEQDTKLENSIATLVARRGVKIGVFHGERAEDWNLLFLSVFAYQTLLRPFARDSSD
jgi:hypothetical protein